MPKSMPREVGNDYSASASKFLFEELFASSHDHMIRSTFPASNEGTAGDIVIVDTGSAVNVCVKTSRGWFKTATLTAV
jgi:hypothetical protein